MKNAAKKFSLVALCLLFPILIVSAKDKEKGKPSNKEHKKASVQVMVDLFQVEHRDLIRNHFIGTRDSLPPGLSKRNGEMPPGLEKQLIRKGHLPPGLEKRLYPFPADLERQLPPLRSGLLRGIIGGRAVILDNRTKVILDIFAIR